MLLVFYNAMAELVLVVADKTIGTLLATSPSGRPRPSTFATFFAMRFLLALSVQAVVELLAYPRWGHLNNIFGKSFTDVQIMLGLGICMFVSFLCTLPFTSRLSEATRGGTGAHQRAPGRETIVNEGTGLL